MAANYRITPDQEAILDTFTCERLTANESNKDQITKFKCRRNIGLARQLESAWEEDTDGVPVIYYVVKNAAGMIVLYFSLKCGTLCDPEYVEKVLDRYEQVKALMEELRSKDLFYNYMEEIRTSNGAAYRQRKEIRSAFWDAEAERDDIKYEKMKEPNRGLLRVDESFPAVELVHFCVNDNYRKEWKALKMGRGMGEVFFWKFVVPKIQEINKLIGCEYVYLFAADGSPDRTLINYYEYALHFEIPTNMSGIKPRYDFMCTFMCKRLRRMSDFRKKHLKKELWKSQDPLALEDYQKLFFEHFNEVPTMVR